MADERTYQLAPDTEYRSGAVGFKSGKDGRYTTSDPAEQRVIEQTFGAEPGEAEPKIKAKDGDG